MSKQKGESSYASQSVYLIQKNKSAFGQSFYVRGFALGGALGNRTRSTHSARHREGYKGGEINFIYSSLEREREREIASA